MAFDWRERITVDPGVLVGKPVVRGTRLAVEFILDLVAEGWTFEEVVANYPGVTVEDICAVAPRRTSEIRPTVDGPKPANGQGPRPVRFYPAVACGCNVWRVRQLLGPQVRTWAWWRRRSSEAEMEATSPRSFPQSSTGLFDESRVETRS
jgi:uncharacterized protein (DUF433 family)